MDRGAFRGGFPFPRPDPDDPDSAAAIRPAESAPPVSGVLRGCRIKTLRGEVPAEALRPGDSLLTRDNGYQPLRWSGQTPPPVTGGGRAVRLRKGALGRGLPERCLWVAPGQRVLIGGDALRDALGRTEALVAAHHLTCLAGVALCAAPPLPVVRLLLDRHELIQCEGTWAESLLSAADGVYRPRPARALLDGDDLRAVLRLMSSP